MILQKEVNEMKKLINLLGWRQILGVSFVCFSSCLLYVGCYVSSSINTISSATNQINSDVGQETNSQVDEEDLSNLRNFEQNRDLWNGKKIYNYNMVMRFVNSGFSTPATAVTIQVRNKKAVSIDPISKEDKRPTIYYTDFDTVEKLFDLIERDLKRKAKIKIKFNAEFGFPKLLEVTYIGQGKREAYHVYIDKFDVV